MSLPDIMRISKREITIMLITTTCPCPCPYNKIKGVYQTISTSNICIISNLIFIFPPLPPPVPAASNQINPPPPYSTAQHPYRPPDSANPPRPLPHPYPHSNSACAESFCADPSSSPAPRAPRLSSSRARVPVRGYRSISWVSCVSPSRLLCWERARRFRCGHAGSCGREIWWWVEE
jgi:hypothetical protein